MSATLHAIVYGPFRSQRHGSTLGINPVPNTREECPPECPMCTHGIADTVPILTRPGQRPTPGVVVTCAARKIIELSKAGEKVSTILVAGVDDPTNHPQLMEITENLRSLRDKWFGKAVLAIQTGGIGLAASDPRRALFLYDKPIVRFEWGTPKTFTAMTGRPAAAMNELATALRSLDRLVVEATFVRGTLDNSSDAEVKAWVKRVAQLAPKEVLLSTVPSTARKGSKGKAVTATRLDQIAALLLAETGIPATLHELEAVSA
jgi:hypothetical protein